MTFAGEDETGRAAPSFGDTELYVSRAADEELFHALVWRKLSVVIAPRRSGKSRLRAHAATRLRADGIRCAGVDLGVIAGPAALDAPAFYRDVALALARGFGVTDGFDAFWDALTVPPPSLWRAFLRDYLPSRVVEPMVVFIDGIEAVLTLPFAAEEFFEAIRAAYDARFDDAGLQRLTFCLLGSASPGEIVDGARKSPFVVSETIYLADFTREEAAPLARQLARAGGDPGRLLDEVYRWTAGHPSMTRKLCDVLLLRGAGAAMPDREGERVAGIVREIFVARGPDRDPDLHDSMERLLARPRARALVELYARVRRGARVVTLGREAEAEELRLSGVMAEHRVGKDMELRVRNLVFEYVFDKAWIGEREAAHTLAGSLTAWREHGKKRANVLRGAALARALLWARERELTLEENEFLREGLAEEARRRRRRIAVVAVALLVAAVTGSQLWNARVAREYRATIAEIEGARDRALEEKASALEVARRARTASEHVGDRLKIVGEATASAGARLDALIRERDRVLHELTGITKEHDKALVDKVAAQAEKDRALDALRAAEAEIERLRHAAGAADAGAHP